MDARTQTSFIAALLCFALAASVLLRTQRQRDRWLFGILASNTGLWYVSTFMLGVVGRVPFWERFNLICAVLLPLSAVRFFGVMVPWETGRTRFLRRASVVAAVVLLGAMLTPFYDHAVVVGGLLLYVTIFLSLALGYLYKLGFETDSRVEGARLRYIALVGGFGGLFTLIEYLPYVGLDIPPVGTILILVFLYALSQSITHYRLIDLYELAGRLGVLTALAFVLAVILWLMRLVSGEQLFLHVVVSAFVVLILFDPLRTKVQEWISQVFFHERFELERTILALRRSVAHILEVDELGEVLMDGLDASPRFTQGALYLLGPDARAFILKNHFGPKPAERVEMAPARPLIDRLSRTGAAVLENAERELEEKRLLGDDREAETAHDIAVTMRALQTSVCLGLRGESGHLYGFLAVRDDRLRDAFSREEVQLLAGLATQVAVTVENSQLYQQMKEKDRLAALGEMAAGLAHEIRNPLGSIKASAQYLSETSEQQEGRGEFLDIIVDEVDRLNRVVSSFLDYARPAPTDPEPIYVNSAVQLTLQFLRPACDSAEVSLHVTMDPDLPKVRIDIEHLRQVLINLVQNAVQAMASGGDIFVETRTQDRFRIRGGARRWVQISVRDTGPGIAPGLLANLFVPFVTTKQQGTGLGLAISQRIVSEAGGRIDVRSRPGIGTTFVVLLPAEPDSTLDSFEAEREPDHSSESDGTRARLEPAEP
ncbi:MAG: two-component system sensor protein [Deltaproteobacteria bacterium]|nr:two-component system sensor protein [Deltaproteobacteria bacterium]MBW1874660.1 two-component system sensor protein [Deltaproteobacteria bacterium]MBW2210346.1 two-component system sensor protein [Deltaproteobacteria bacterium]MBW2213533.1 two-component system sensor protein [Deltaproteobacteria bacterium]MBW2379251.1 two-component system sensor protein [Deltaproteobacteria bacterium]